MEILNYYRRRKSFDQFTINHLCKFDLPINYLGFIIKYHPLEITGLLTKEPHTIGVEIDDAIVKVNFLDIDNLHFYELDYGDEKYIEPIVQLAYNNIPEGGIFYDTGDGHIYNFFEYPEDIARDNRSPMFSSFDDFFSSLRLFKLSNIDINFYEEWEIQVPENKDELTFPWES